jgi:hypothetical protein
MFRKSNFCARDEPGAAGCRGAANSLPSVSKYRTAS